MAPEFSPQAVAGRRRATGVRLQKVAAELRAIANITLQHGMANDFQFLGKKEDEAVGKIVATLVKCDKALVSVAKHLGVE